MVEGHSSSIKVEEMPKLFSRSNTKICQNKSSNVETNLNKLSKMKSQSDMKAQVQVQESPSDVKACSQSLIDASTKQKLSGNVVSEDMKTSVSELNCVKSAEVKSNNFAFGKIKHFVEVKADVKIQDCNH